MRDPSITDEAWSRMSAVERGKFLWVLTDEPVHAASAAVNVLDSSEPRRAFASRWFPAGPFFGARAVHKHLEGCILGEIAVPVVILEPVPTTRRLSPHGGRFSAAGLRDLVREVAVEYLVAHGEPITEKELTIRVRRQCNAPVREIDRAHSELDAFLRRGRGDRRSRTRRA